MPSDVFTCVLERENGIYPIYEIAGIVLFRFTVLSTLFGGKDGNPKNILRPKKGIEDIILILLLR